MNTWVWDQVRLEFVEIDVEGTIETEGGGDGGNDYMVLADIQITPCIKTYLERSSGSSSRSWGAQDQGFFGRYRR